MAVPTVSTATPSAGPTGGRTRVVLTGTNFRLPTASTALPAPEPDPTVSVQFRQTVTRKGVSNVITRDATRVEVHSATELSCLTPVGDHAEANASLAADIIVTNLDDDGDPITGETVTKTAFYTYALPSLAVESDYQRVIRALIQELKRQVCEETVLTTETDWDDDAADGLQTTPEPKVPSLTLIGPRLERSEVRQFTSPTKTQSGLTFNNYRPAPLVDLEFDLVLATGGEAAMTQGLNLCVQVVEFFRRNTELVVALDPDDESAGNAEFQMQLLADPVPDNLPNLDNLRSFRGSFVVQGVPLEGLPGVSDDLLFRKGYAAETFEITTQRTEVE